MRMQAYSIDTIFATPKLGFSPSHGRFLPGILKGNELAERKAHVAHSAKVASGLVSLQNPAKVSEPKNSECSLISGR